MAVDAGGALRFHAGMENREEIRALLDLPLVELAARADAVRARHAPGRLDVCGIVNAKSGRCGEDCRFCAQSARHRTGIPEHGLLTRDELVRAAAAARAHGAGRFGIVTSGNRLSPAEFDRVAESIAAIRGETDIALCASLGALNAAQLTALRDAGLSRYHHNIETSPGFFPRIVTTHSYAEREATVRAAQEAGLEVCCGGILGLGESWDDRIEMALTLRRLGVDSVPINILFPIPGTPLGDQPVMSATEAIRAIALFRLVIEKGVVKIAAGRERILGDFQGLAFLAGANGMITGGYLTIPGRSADADNKLIEEIRRAWTD